MVLSKNQNHQIQSIYTSLFKAVLWQMYKSVNQTVYVLIFQKGPETIRNSTEARRYAFFLD